MLSKVVILALAVSGAFAQGAVEVPATGSVSFQSPGYPSNYDDSLSVSWTISGPEGSGIQFDAEDFYTESGYDVLSFSEVINGASVNLGSFSGNGGGPSGLKSASNNVVATFESDSSVNHKGFKINAKVPLCPSGQNTCPGDETTCISSSDYCDGVQDCPDNADEANCPEPGSCGVQVIKPDLSAAGAKGLKALIAAMTAKKTPERIVGGTEVVPHSWPWQIIMLTSAGRHLCGGSIINNNWILTAAHCCVAMSPVPASYKVRIGAHNYQANEDGAQTLTLSKVIVHPRYNPSGTNNDICLLKFESPITFTQTVSPVCLGREVPEDGRLCWVTGWGEAQGTGSFEEKVRQIKLEEAGLLPPKTNEDRPAQTKLRQVDSLIVNQESCSATWGGRVTADMICAQAPGKSACRGDSGGPLVCQDGDTFNLVGVVSWGSVPCGRANPAVYSRVSYGLAWINEQLANN